MFKMYGGFTRPAIKEVAKSSMKPEPPKPSRVLVVDDEEPIRRFVDRVLSDLGYHTALAADGVEALRIAAQLGAFDFLVTDLMMPQMRGDDLAQHLLRDQPHLRVLYLTGHSDRLFRNRVILGENQAFLDKPCSPDGLREALALIAPGTPETGGGRFLV